MTDRFLLIHGLTRQQFIMFREAMSDADLPLLFYLQEESKIGNQLEQPAAALPAAQEKCSGIPLQLLKHSQIELLSRLRDIWWEVLNLEPEVVMITGSNRDWSGRELVERIEAELELAVSYRSRKGSTD